MQCEAEACCRIEEGKRRIGSMVANLPIGRRHAQPFAALSHEQFQPKRAFDIALSTEEVAKTLAGTAVFTVSNANNEFVLISDPEGQRSLGLLCFRQEDAESLLAQVIHFSFSSLIFCFSFFVLLSVLDFTAFLFRGVVVD